MIILTAITDKLQVVLSGAVTTNQLQCMATYQVSNGNSISYERSIVNTNNATDVDLVGSPTEGTKRVVDYISIYNADTASANVTVKIDTGSGEFILHKASVGSGSQLIYDRESGFHSQSPTSSFGAQNSVILTNDVENANVVANTIADITGLGFAVQANKTYWFKFIIPYTAALATTGSRWGVNCSTGTAAGLSMTSEYSLSSTATTRNDNVQAFDSPASCNASSASTGNNLCIMEGKITPTLDGVFVARFASEVSASAITAKAGAICHYQQLTN